MKLTVESDAVEEAREAVASACGMLLTIREKIGAYETVPLTLRREIQEVRNHLYAVQVDLDSLGGRDPKQVQADRIAKRKQTIERGEG